MQGITSCSMLVFVLLVLNLASAAAFQHVPNSAFRTAFNSRHGRAFTAWSPAVGGRARKPRRSQAQDHINMLAERTPLIAGNWKMNMHLADAITLAKAVSQTAASTPDVEVAVVPPHPYLTAISSAVQGSPVQVGAQDCYYEEKGAFTGATGAGMIQSCGCDYVLSGHSERRSVFKDTDQKINLKLKRILSTGLKCILCIGESKDEREAGITNTVLATGLTATPEMAQDTHAYVRSWFRDNYSAAAADAIRIQYGGSVSPETVDELMACPDIDGALVGGA